MKHLLPILMVAMSVPSFAQNPIIRLTYEHVLDYLTMQTVSYHEFTYSGNRGGVIDDPQTLVAPWNTDNGKYDNVNSDLMLTYRDVSKTGKPIDSTEQWFDNADRLIYAHRYSQNTHIYDTIVYNGSNIDSSISYMSTANPTNNTRTVVVYTNPGQRGMIRTYKGGKLLHINTLSYDASGNLVKELRVSPVMPDTLMKLYTYNSNKKRTSAITFKNGKGYSLDTFEMYTFAYDAQGRNDITWQSTERDSLTGNIKPLYKMHNGYYLSQLDYVQKYKWDEKLKQYDIWDEYNFKYNTFGYISDLYESLEQGKKMIVRGFIYTHVWPLAIANPQPQPTIIQLYPNPAGEILTFRISIEEAQPFTASITDMQGRVLMQWNEAPAKTYTRTIPTAALPAGMYVLRVDGKETTTRSFVVRK